MDRTLRASRDRDEFAVEAVITMLSLLQDFYKMFGGTAIRNRHWQSTGSRRRGLPVRCWSRQSSIKAKKDAAQVRR